MRSIQAKGFSGFTYVEILITLTIVAILFVPMMQLFSQAMGATTTSREMIIALNLGRWEMERVKNLGSNATRLKALWNSPWPPEREGEPLEFNGRLWRIDRFLKAESDLLEVTVFVRREGQKKPLVALTSLLTDTAWSRGDQIRR